MSIRVLSVCGFAILFTAACHKTPPLSTNAVPAPTPPVASTPAPRPAPPAQRAALQTPRSTPPAPRPSAITAQDRDTLNQHLAHLSDALFDYDKTTIRADAHTALSGDVVVVKGILQSYPNQKLIVVGSADERGSAEYNLALGDKRAHAAEQFLVSMGVPQAQLTVVSYGKERPVCQEQTEACWQKNRRAHITAAP